jgi:hypothetical protein
VLGAGNKTTDRTEEKVQQHQVFMHVFAWEVQNLKKIVPASLFFWGAPGGFTACAAAPTAHLGVFAWFKSRLDPGHVFLES